VTKNYKDITGDLSAYVGELRKAIPDVMGEFGKLGQAAKREGALDGKTKELIALALGVAAHCDGCIGFHMKALIQARATHEEVAEALGMAIYMGGGPSTMYAADALRAFDQLTQA
jgi:AhpD family alkylhydroperoxidase